MGETAIGRMGERAAKSSMVGRKTRRAGDTVCQRWLSAPVLSRGVRMVSPTAPLLKRVPLRDRFEIYASRVTAQNRRGCPIKRIESSARRVFRPT